MTDHREHLLSYTEDMFCRGAAIVGLRAGLRQRIYWRPSSLATRVCRCLVCGTSQNYQL